MGGGYFNPLPPPTWNRVKLNESFFYQKLNASRRPTPLVIFYSHFSYARAKDLKFYEFLNNVEGVTGFYQIYPFCFMHEKGFPGSLWEKAIDVSCVQKVFQVLYGHMHFMFYACRMFSRFFKGKSCRCFMCVEVFQLHNEHMRLMFYACRMFSRFFTGVRCRCFMCVEGVSGSLRTYAHLCHRCFTYECSSCSI